METTEKPQQVRTEVIKSKALFLKEFEAKEDIKAARGHRLLSGTRFKTIAMPLLYKLFQRMPGFIALAPVRFLVFVFRFLFFWRRNPIRLSCEYICHIADRKGYSHEPKQLYQQFLSNLSGAAQNYFKLYRYGADKAMERVNLSTNDAKRINHLIEQYGGVVIAVPHNFCTAFAATKLDRAFPLLLISRNSSTIERTKIAIDFYERMGVTVLMVRGGNPFELSRTLFSVLKSGKSVAATVDSIEKSTNAVDVEIFDQTVGFNPWAAKIAARMGVPVIPSYYRSRDTEVKAIIGDAIISDDADKIVKHYMHFFETNILKDPASWGFLADKRWMRILRSSYEEQAVVTKPRTAS